MTLQYLSDNFGNRTAVVIPINEWNKITTKYNDLDIAEDLSIPDWHKEIIDFRLKNYKENPNNVTDYDVFCKEIEAELL